MATLTSRLESYFHFAEHQTSWPTETLDGLTTFVTDSVVIVPSPFSSR